MLPRGCRSVQVLFGECPRPVILCNSSIGTRMIRGRMAHLCLFIWFATSQSLDRDKVQKVVLSRQQTHLLFVRLAGACLDSPEPRAGFRAAPVAV